MSCGGVAAASLRMRLSAGMQPVLQRLEGQRAVADDSQLAVEHETVRGGAPAARRRTSGK